MFTPSIEEVISLTKQDYNVIPIGFTYLSDHETCISHFEKVRHERYSFLLESVEGGERWARYSYIGRRPFLVISSTGQNVKLSFLKENESRTLNEQGSPLEIVKTHISRYKSPKLPELPPFTGGAVGFFGYDLIHTFENVPTPLSPTNQSNEMEFLFTDELIVFDHLKQKTTIICNLHVSPDDQVEMIRKKYELVCDSISYTYQELQNPPKQTTQKKEFVDKQKTTGLNVRSSHTKEEFCTMVDKAKEYIKSGDVFQVVLSQRFEQETEADPFDVYRLLRSMNPSPYMYYYKSKDMFIVGASPELLVKVDKGIVENRPIAGTRPRGKTREEDVQFEKELLMDEKERAEHVMLVDLGRNDVGRVSEFGTVKLDSYMEIERYSHVMHMVSHVKGKMQSSKDFFDALRSCMPAGTVSGAPKVRAMQIISELEKEARGVYGGAIGYLGFNGQMDSCIAIRTIVFQDGKAYVQAGAGVVADSVPEREYEETVNKAKAMLQAIEGGTDPIQIQMPALSTR
ncbi:anthranilate synthase component I [Fictibacillus nanhaiensis]|uniref:anthranilate synthase component I n=1 Tax=Fictibacillus nanhaiensis TaxID=742169 RepID=UPI001C964B49|nr:anthranilate synthase component I [Fictibacillus nanhaiensis]MBY6036841.1 anthranilate synthase component I [Fictibacillus nanhaiensis]